MSKHQESEEDEKFHPKDAVGAAIQGIFVTGVAGAFVSGVQNALAKQNYGVWGAVTRTGGTIAIFGMYEGCSYKKELFFSFFFFSLCVTDDEIRINKHSFNGWYIHFRS